MAIIIFFTKDDPVGNKVILWISTTWVYRQILYVHIKKVRQTAMVHHSTFTEHDHTIQSDHAYVSM